MKVLGLSQMGVWVSMRLGYLRRFRVQGPRDLVSRLYGYTLGYKRTSHNPAP